MNYPRPEYTKFGGHGRDFNGKKKARGLKMMLVARALLRAEDPVMQERFKHPRHTRKFKQA